MLIYRNPELNRFVKEADWIAAGRPAGWASIRYPRLVGRGSGSKKGYQSLKRWAKKFKQRGPYKDPSGNKLTKEEYGDLWAKAQLLIDRTEAAIYELTVSERKRSLIGEVKKMLKNLDGRLAEDLPQDIITARAVQLADQTIDAVVTFVRADDYTLEEAYDLLDEVNSSFVTLPIPARKFSYTQIAFSINTEDALAYSVPEVRKETPLYTNASQRNLDGWPRAYQTARYMLQELDKYIEGATKVTEIQVRFRWEPSTPDESVLVRSKKRIVNKALAKKKKTTKRVRP